MRPHRPRQNEHQTREEALAIRDTLPAIQADAYPLGPDYLAHPDRRYVGDLEADLPVAHANLRWPQHESVCLIR